MMSSQAPIAEDAVLEMDERKLKALDSEKQAAGEFAAGGGAAGEAAPGSGEEQADTSFDELLYPYHTIQYSQICLKL